MTFQVRPENIERVQALTNEERTALKHFLTSKEHYSITTVMFEASQLSLNTKHALEGIFFRNGFLMISLLNAIAIDLFDEFQCVSDQLGL